MLFKLFKLSNPTLLIYILKKLKNIVNQTNFCFDLDGLRIREYNNLNTILFELFIEKQYFDECPGVGEQFYDHS